MKIFQVSEIDYVAAPEQDIAGRFFDKYIEAAGRIKDPTFKTIEWSLEDFGIDSKQEFRRRLGILEAAGHKIPGIFAIKIGQPMWDYLTAEERAAGNSPFPVRQLTPQ